MTDDTLTIDPNRPCREPLAYEVFEHLTQETGLAGPLAETLRLWRVEGLAPVEVAQRLSITLPRCIDRLEECLRACKEHNWDRTERDEKRDVIEAHANRQPGGSPAAAVYDENGRRVGARPPLVTVDDLLGRRWR